MRVLPDMLARRLHFGVERASSRINAAESPVAGAGASSASNVAVLPTPDRVAVRLRRWGWLLVQFNAQYEETQIAAGFTLGGGIFINGERPVSLTTPFTAFTAGVATEGGSHAAGQTWRGWVYTLAPQSLTWAGGLSTAYDGEQASGGPLPQVLYQTYTPYLCPPGEYSVEARFRRNSTNASAATLRNRRLTVRAVC